MSREALAKVVQRAISDAGFRRQLSSDPAGALRGFDLTADEMSAVRAGDAGRLSTLGIDQRMSKAFALGGAVAATRMAQSDLSAGNAAMIDDGSSASGTIIPHDPASTLTADDDGGASTRSVIRDDPDGLLAIHASRVSGGTASVRTGDDWKFTDRAVAEVSVAPIEGSPEATAAELKANTGGMANYPAHDGLAGPSGVASVRAGDDWARAGTQADDSARIGSARLDDASATGSDSAARLAKLDEKLSSEGSPAVDASGGSAGETTAFIDESEAYLTTVGYDSSASGSVVTDAHDRGDGSAHATWGGDENAGPTSIADDDAAGGSAPSEGGPNISD